MTQPLLYTELYTTIPLNLFCSSYYYVTFLLYNIDNKYVLFDIDKGLTEEEVILQNAVSESKEAEQKIQRAALVLRMREGMGSLARVLKTIEVI